MLVEIQNYIEKALNEYTSGDWYQELLYAKEKYFLVTGQIFETDDDYEERMASFNNWYIFRYIPRDSIRTPIKDFCLKYNLDSEIRETLNRVRFSCYTYKGSSKKGEYLRDSLLSKDILIADHEIPSFLPGDIFLGWSCSYQNKSFLLEGHCPLPRNARSIIWNECKRVLKKKDPHLEQIFLVKLQKARTRMKRYKHLSPEKLFIFK